MSNHPYLVRHEYAPRHLLAIGVALVVLAVALLLMWAGSVR